MPYKYIDLKIENYVATVAMARVDALNALSLEFASEIASVFRELGANDDVRAIIFCSKARIFCAGLDLKEAASGASQQAKVVLDVIRQSQPLFDCCNFIEECPKPVIAAVHGKCIGGGLDMISACDIRLATEDAVFCLKEAAIGLVADMGVLQRLPKIVGQGFAREMAYTAANYTARDVEKTGLLNGIYADQASLMAAAQKLAAQIAANAPLGIKYTKEVLNFSRYVNVYEGMALAVQKNAILLMSDDLKEAMMSFLERRPPDFKGK
ncbi:MAG TPA: enoyl-CoA hydratase-related protein [Smithellaceae bacterium]|jgi:enoyl-CoA hydratase|nr:enoyl-CoA hydratase-related protein [Smithellaceae bacterium]HOG83041.1 enoyl-CoA hydratase-related protein [Smithellaceae bacterium]